MKLEPTTNEPSTLNEAEKASHLKRQEVDALALARSELLDWVGHAVGEPLKQILDTLQVLRDTPLSHEQSTCLEKLQRAGNGLVTVWNDMMDVSRIEAGQMVLEEIDFDLLTAVAEVTGLIKKASLKRNLEVTCLIHKDVPATVRGDPGRLRQVLASFLSDVIRSSCGNEMVLTAKLIEGSADAITIRFEVTSVGVTSVVETKPESLSGAAGERTPSTPLPENTGSSFSLSKRLAQFMGARFGTEVRPRDGSVAWLNVKLKKAAESQLCLATVRPDLRNLAVLAVVDGEGTYPSLVAQTLSWGMSCDLAENASQALEMLRGASLRGKPYDVAILDMQLPGTDGMELARAIQDDPGLSTVRPVMLIAVGLRGQAEKARQAGILGYLTKPVNQSELYNCLALVMTQQRIDSAPSSGPHQPLITTHKLKEAKARRQARVLVAEDNTVNQMVVVRMLEKLGARAEVAVDGFEAVEACKRSHYDLVLMDCQMPNMNGFAATEAIIEAERAAGGTHTPIIAVTAHAMQGDRKNCLAAGMDDYIAKPFSLAQIRELISRWIPSDNSQPADIGAGISAQEAAIDPSVLEGLGVRPDDDHADFLMDLSVQFLSEASGRLTQLDEALNRSDALALKRAAHGLKGSSSVMGAKPMAALCAQLEEHSTPGGLPGAAPLIAQLKDEFRRVEKELSVLPSATTCG